MSWSVEGWRSIRGVEDSDRDHVPQVTDRTVVQGLAGEFLIEIAITELVLGLGDGG